MESPHLDCLPSPRADTCCASGSTCAFCGLPQFCGVIFKFARSEDALGLMLTAGVRSGMPASGLRRSRRFSRAAPHFFAVRLRHFTEDIREQLDRARLQAPFCQTCLNGGGENPPWSAAVNQYGGLAAP